MFSKAAVLISKEGKFLLVQEKHPYQGRSWNWPQGRIEEGESPEDAALREGSEETGFELNLERKIDVLTETFPDTKVLHVFLANVIGGWLIVPPGEILNARWLSVEEIENMENQLVGQWILQAIRKIN